MAVGVFERQPPMLTPSPDQLGGLALADTARSIQRTHDTLPRTRPLTGRPDTDAVVAAVLAAFPAALHRVARTAVDGTRLSRTAVSTDGSAKALAARPAPLDTTVDSQAGRSARTIRTATPAEAVAGGIASLQRLAMRARLYADELFAGEATWYAVSPIAALLREFGQRCDTLSDHLQPARYQMEEALTALDAIGAGRGALSHFTRSEAGGCAAVHTDAAPAFLAEHPEHRTAFATQATRATDAYAHAEASRDRLAGDLNLILAQVDELQPRPPAGDERGG